MSLYDSYNTTKAYEYARKWSNNDDDHPLRNPAYSSEGGHDCANFVSQCLYAGGMKTYGDWYFEDDKIIVGQYIPRKGSVAWIRASAFGQFWKKHARSTTTVNLKDIKSNSSFKSRVYDKTQLGDVLALVHPNGDAYHIMFISGKGKTNDNYDIFYCAHTKERRHDGFYDKLNKILPLGPNDKLTIFHF
ncbi:amidase domain-containing protein [Clostridium sp. ZS2-4]|uniref:amidase domain-containing protein n=1 Tax=Clostridium sp. ZS2-4 TaxID=2987703 RepID=UPI00227AC43A|nr:amidase domain-containing protein [Clostridium sp. ZS2-4]MCY6356180.1 amidase domain-containing protein [Clostridium sp. ZS2-4]